MLGYFFISQRGLKSTVINVIENLLCRLIQRVVGVILRLLQSLFSFIVLHPKGQGNFGHVLIVESSTLSSRFLDLAHLRLLSKVCLLFLMVIFNFCCIMLVFLELQSTFIFIFDLLKPLLQLLYMSMTWLSERNSITSLLKGSL